MKLTYIYPPLFTPCYPIATRMITGNLRRNEKLDVTFSQIPVRAYKYVNTILLGLETVSDFALKNIKKGYTWNDIQEAVDQMIRHMDRNIFLGIHMNILSLFPNLELLTQKPSYFGISDRKEDMEHSTGKNYFIHLLKQAGMDAPLLLPSGKLIADRENPAGLDYGFLSSDLPVMRYDVQGRILPSDLNLMDEAVIKGILKRKSKRLQ